VAGTEGGGGGGGKLGGNVTLPGIGPVKKKVVIAIGTVAGGFVLWRYWQARQEAAAPVAGDSDGDGFADGGTLPSVSGAVSGDNSYGLPGQDTTTDSYGFQGTTNSQWTQYATTQLSAASDKWSYGDIASALGAFINNKPLTSTQQDIVQAAIALAGPPPEGTHPIIPGGDTPITVAPTGLKVLSTTSTTVTLQWNKVAGAGYYRVYRSGSSTNVGATDAANNSIVIGGLTPNTSYSFLVAADTTSQIPGPKSTPVTAKTKAVTLAKPTGVKVSSVTKTTAVASCTAVKGATGYLWYINHLAHGHSDGPKYTLQGLRANTSYKLSVKADTQTQGPGPESGQVSFRTKK
jgi:hypothetical protein